MTDDQTDKLPVDNQPAVPDGGWGWMVLFGSFITFLIADGWSFSFGVLFPEIVDYFSEPKGISALVGTLLYAVPMIISPLACALVNTYGCRVVCICGGVISGCSLALAALANSVTALCLVVGVVTGVGLAMLYVSSFFIVTIYFERRRGLATGLAVTGSGVGALAFPPIIEYLIETYTWHGTLLIAGGICLNTIVAGALYRPLSSVEQSSRNKYKVNHSKKGCVYYIKLLAQEFCQVISAMCDSTALKSLPLLLFCGANLVLYLWISMPYVYLVDCALLVESTTSRMAALLLSLAGIGRIIGQIIFGMIGDAPSVSACMIYGLGVAVAGLATLLVPLLTKAYTGLAVYATVFGSTAAVTYVLPMICLVEMLGLAHAINAFGILQLVQGIGTLLGTPVAGWLFDAYSSYSSSFYIAGAMMLVSGLSLLPIPWMVKCHPHDTKNDVVVTVEKNDPSTSSA